MPQPSRKMAPGEDAASMAFIPGGAFQMGSDRHYPEERPVHPVTVDGFWMQRTPVTNRQFAEFVKATGYVTFAEIPPRRKTTPAPCRTCSTPGLLYSRRRRARLTSAIGHNGGFI